MPTFSEQKTIIDNVKEKWQGPRSAEHHNEDINTQAALKQSVSLRNTDSIIPKGKEFGVEKDMLSDRAYRGEGVRQPFSKNMLSDRKF